MNVCESIDSICKSAFCLDFALRATWLPFRKGGVEGLLNSPRRQCMMTDLRYVADGVVAWICGYFPCYWEFCGGLVCIYSGVCEPPVAIISLRTLERMHATPQVRKQHYTAHAKLASSYNKLEANGCRLRFLHQWSAKDHSHVVSNRWPTVWSLLGLPAARVPGLGQITLWMCTQKIEGPSGEKNCSEIQK